MISLKIIKSIAACSVFIVVVTSFMGIHSHWFSERKDSFIMQEEIKDSEVTDAGLVSSAKDKSKVIDEEIKANNSESNTSNDSKEQSNDLKIIDDRPEVAPPVISDEDTALEQADVNIYYVDNENIEYKTEFLPLSPRYIFAFWKYYNKIGEEVTLNDIHIENDGSEYAEPNIAGYNGSDGYIMNVIVSSNLKEYYKYIPEDKLIESLKQTLLGYSDDMSVEFNLVFE